MTKHRVAATALIVVTAIATWLTWRWYRIPRDDGLWLEKDPQYLGGGVEDEFMGHDLRARVVASGERSHK